MEYASINQRWHTHVLETSIAHYRGDIQAVTKVISQFFNEDSCFTPSKFGFIIPIIIDSVWITHQNKLIILQELKTLGIRVTTLGRRIYGRKIPALFYIEMHDLRMLDLLFSMGYRIGGSILEYMIRHEPTISLDYFHYLMENSKLEQPALATLVTNIWCEDRTDLLDYLCEYYELNFTEGCTDIYMRITEYENIGLLRRIKEYLNLERFLDGYIFRRILNKNNVELLTFLLENCPGIEKCMLYSRGITALRRENLIKLKDVRLLRAYCRYPVPFWAIRDCIKAEWMEGFEIVLNNVREQNQEWQEDVLNRLKKFCKKPRNPFLFKCYNAINNAFPENTNSPVGILTPAEIEEELEEAGIDPTEVQDG